MDDTEKFLREQRTVMLKRLSREDIPQGVLSKVMETWLEIEKTLRERFDG